MGDGWLDQFANLSTGLVQPLDDIMYRVWHGHQKGVSEPPKLTDKARTTLYATLMQWRTDEGADPKNIQSGYRNLSDSQLSRLVTQLVQSGTWQKLIQRTNAKEEAESGGGEGGGLDDLLNWGETPPKLFDVGGVQMYYDPVRGWVQLNKEVSPEDNQANILAQIEAQKKAQLEQLYASDPYKYWIQNWLQSSGGQMPPTPPAVAALTGGQIQPDAPFSAVPLSTPSSQWWGGLLPSEQQTVQGAVNWMGIDPNDWMAMYRKMIPSYGTRVGNTSWLR